MANFDPDTDYVPSDQAQFDEMTAALEGAPNRAQQFAALVSYYRAGYNPEDIAAVAMLSKVTPVASPSQSYPVTGPVGARLGPAWRAEAGAAFARPPGPSERVFTPPTAPGGILNRLGMTKPSMQRNKTKP